MNKHKPNCSSNISCAVYHANGVCPGYKPCDCGVEKPKKEITAPTPKVLDWELEAMKQIGIVLSSKDPLIIKLSAIKILIQSTTQRGRELGYAEAKEMALRLSKAQEDLNKLVCGKCKKEGRDEVLKEIEEKVYEWGDGMGMRKYKIAVFALLKSIKGNE